MRKPIIIFFSLIVCLFMTSQALAFQPLPDTYDQHEKDGPPVSDEGEESLTDGRFIAYDNGTVLDTRTNLMWAAKDNGSSINWADAKSYCENYRGGGYTDWRMPTQEELAGLYDAGKSQSQECYPAIKVHVATDLIHLTCCCPWASETLELRMQAASFNFENGATLMGPQSSENNKRALPVRPAARP